MVTIEKNLKGNSIQYFLHIIELLISLITIVELLIRLITIRIESYLVHLILFSIPVN